MCINMISQREFLLNTIPNSGRKEGLCIKEFDVSQVAYEFNRMIIRTATPEYD